eukprot:692825-Prymnesium_polylepis.1
MCIRDRCSALWRGLVASRRIAGGCRAEPTGRGALGRGGASPVSQRHTLAALYKSPIGAPTYPGGQGSGCPASGVLNLSTAPTGIFGLPLANCRRVLEKVEH